MINQHIQSLNLKRMKSIGRIFGVIVLIFALNSCDYIENLGLTDEQIVAGLKEALEIGTDTAVAKLSAVNGYYKGDIINVKIPLPDEAEYIRNLITSNNKLADVINLDSYFENVVKSVNRAAEYAATSAAPIFVTAITNISFTDAVSILDGDNPNTTSVEKSQTAATEYFKDVTYVNLVDLFAPHIDDALDQDLGLGFSAVDAWEALTSKYNSLVSSWVVQAALLALPDVNLPNKINDDLGEFCTGKALDGLFFKVGEEEKQIREDPFQWASQTIQDVFGSVL